MLDQMCAVHGITCDMIFIIKVEFLPDILKIVQQLLHSHLLARLVHNVVHFVLKVVEVEAEQVGQGRLVTHGELDPSGLNQLVPGKLMLVSLSFALGVQTPSGSIWPRGFLERVQWSVGVSMVSYSLS